MAIALGIVMGLVLGLTGAGGSIFAMPLLIYGLGLTPAEAAPISLLAVTLAAGLGALRAWQKSYVRYRAATLIALAGMATAPWGLMAAHRLPVATLSLIFAVVVSIAGLRLLQQSLARPEEASVLRAGVDGDGPAASGPLCSLNPETGRIVWTARSAFAISGLGLIVGFLSGLLGVGGGFVVVPALRWLTPLSMHSAVATSLMAIGLTSAGTVLLHTQQAGAIAWHLALPFAAGAGLGMLAAQKIAPRIAGPRLQQAFAVLMLLVAAGMLLSSYSKLV